MPGPTAATPRQMQLAQSTRPNETTPEQAAQWQGYQQANQWRINLPPQVSPNGSGMLPPRDLSWALTPDMVQRMIQPGAASQMHPIPTQALKGQYADQFQQQGGNTFIPGNFILDLQRQAAEAMYTPSQRAQDLANQQTQAATDPTYSPPMAPVNGPDTTATNQVYSVPLAQAQSMFGDVSQYQSDGTNVFIPADAINQVQPTQGMPEENVFGVPKSTWDQLPTWQKWVIPALPYVNTGLQAVTGGIMGAALGGPVGAVAGALGMAGLAKAAESNPTLASALNFLDLPAEGVERAGGVMSQILDSIAHPELYGPVSEVLQNMGAAWEAGHSLYNVSFSGFQGPDGKETVYKEVLGQPKAETWTVEQGHAGSLALAEIRRRIANADVTGETTEQITNDVVGRFGFAADVREMVGHMLIDPLNLMGDVANAAGYKIAKAAGNETLASSFKEFSQLAQVGENFQKGLRGEYGKVINAEGKLVNRPAAVRAAEMVQDLIMPPAYRNDVAEALREYGITVRRVWTPEERANADAFTKFMADLDKAGNWNLYDRTQRKGLSSVVGFVLDRARGLTPQARASEVLHTWVDGLQAILAKGDYSSPEDITKFFYSISRMTPKDSVLATDGISLAKWFDSAETQMMPSALRDLEPAIKQKYDTWTAYKAPRDFITELSQLLGRDPYDFMKDVHQATGAEAEAMIRAAVNNLAVAGEKDRLGKLLAGGLSPKVLKEAVDYFTTKGVVAFDSGSFRADVIEMLSDGIDKWAAHWFNVKPQGWVTRLGGVVKRAQTFVLLGFNPSSMVRNAMDNIMNMAWDGLLGGSTSASRKAFYTDMGFVPSRLHAAMSPADVGELGEHLKLGKEIRKAGAANDTLAGFDRALSKITDSKLPIFLTFSRKIEEWSSEIAMTNAMMQFWEKHWRAGDGFDHLPSDLAQSLDGLYGDGTAARVEAMVARGRNKAQIEKSIFKNWRKPSVRDVMTAEEGELFNHFPGLVDRLDSAVSQASTPADIRSAFAAARQETQASIRDMVTRSAETRTQMAQASVTISGQPGVLDEARKMHQRLDEFWHNHFGNMEDAATRAHAASSQEESALIWLQAFQEADRNWNEYQNISDDITLGVFKGMGTSDEDMTRVQLLMGDGVDDRVGLRQMWSAFYAERRRRLEEHINDTRGLSKKDRAQAWQELQTSLNDMYLDAIINEFDIQGEIDGYFGRAYSRFMGEDQPGPEFERALTWRFNQRKVRQSMAAVEAYFRNYGVMPPKLLDAWTLPTFDEALRVELLIPSDIRQQIDILLAGVPMGASMSEIRSRFYREIYDPYIDRLQAEADKWDPNNPNPPAPEPGPAPAPVTEPPQAGQPPAQPPVDEAARQILINQMRDYINQIAPQMQAETPPTQPGPDVIDNIQARAQEQQELAQANRQGVFRLAQEFGIGVDTPGDQMHILNILRQYYHVDSIGQVTETMAADAFSRREVMKGAINKEAQKRLDARLLEWRAQQAQDAQSERILALNAARGSEEDFSKEMYSHLYRVAHGEALAKGYHAGDAERIATETADEQTGAVMKIQNAIADTWAQENGQTRADYYKRLILLVEGENQGMEGLRQLPPADQVESRMREAIRAARQYANDTEFVRWSQSVLDRGRTALNREGLLQEWNAAYEYLSALRDYNYLQSNGKVYDLGEQLQPGGLPYLKSFKTDADRLYQAGMSFHEVESAALGRPIGKYYFSYRPPEGGPVFLSRIYNSVEEAHAAMQGYLMELDGLPVLGPGLAQRARGEFLERAWIKIGDRYFFGNDHAQAIAEAVKAGIYRAGRQQAYDMGFETSFGRKIDRNQAIDEFGTGVSERMDNANRRLRFLDQGLGQGTKGLTKWLSDGTAVIRAFEAADVSTFVHEIAHAWMPNMGEKDLSIVSNWLRAQYDMELPQGWQYGHENYVLAKERFARAFERYLAEGRPPVPTLKGVFERFKSWMITIYQKISGTDIDVRLTSEIRNLFDRWIGGAENQAEIQRNYDMMLEVRADWRGGETYKKLSQFDPAAIRAFVEGPDYPKITSFDAMVSHYDYDYQLILSRRPELAQKFMDQHPEARTTPAAPAPAAAPAQPAAPGLPTAPEGITIRRNETHDGIEVKFPGKPDETTLEKLKAAGFRWNRATRVWYSKDTPQAREKLRGIWRQATEPLPAPPPIPVAEPTTMTGWPTFEEWSKTKRKPNRDAYNEMIYDAVFREELGYEDAIKLADKATADRGMIDRITARAGELTREEFYNALLPYGIDAKRAIELHRNTITFGDRMKMPISDRVRAEYPELEVSKKPAPTFGQKPGKPKKPEQPNIFQGGEDLPIFSHTPQNAEPETFAPQPENQQPSLIDMQQQVKGIEPVNAPDVSMPEGGLFTPPPPDLTKTPGGFRGVIEDGYVKVYRGEEFIAAGTLGNDGKIHDIEFADVSFQKSNPTRQAAMDVMQEIERQQKPKQAEPPALKEGDLFTHNDKTYKVTDVDFFGKQIRIVPTQGYPITGLFDFGSFERQFGQKIDTAAFNVTHFVDAAKQVIINYLSEHPETQRKDLVHVLDFMDVPGYGRVSMHDFVRSIGKDEAINFFEDLYAPKEKGPISTPIPIVSTEPLPGAIEYIKQQINSGMGDFQTGRSFEEWAQQTLGVDMNQEENLNLAYDAMEGAFNLVARDVRAELETAKAPLAARLQRLDDLEGQLLRARRTLSKMKLQQFSTPLTISEAAGWAADIRPGDILTEPTAGTANLVDRFFGRNDILVKVNELDPGRRRVLEAIGYHPTGINVISGEWILGKDGKILGPNGTVVICNPPWGAYATGKYGMPVSGIAGLKLNDWSQRFTMMILDRLAEGGRFVGVMPMNWVGTIDRGTRFFNPHASEFLRFLQERYNLKAIIQSPEGAYNKRGTNIDSLLVVIDKTPKQDPTFIMAFGETQPRNWEEYAKLVEELSQNGRSARSTANIDRAQSLLAGEIDDTINARRPAYGPDSNGLADPNARAGKPDSDPANIGKPASAPKPKPAPGPSAQRAEPAALPERPAPVDSGRTAPTGGTGERIPGGGAPVSGPDQRTAPAGTGQQQRPNAQPPAQQPTTPAPAAAQPAAGSEPIPVEQPAPGPSQPLPELPPRNEPAPHELTPEEQRASLDAEVVARKPPTANRVDPIELPGYSVEFLERLNTSRNTAASSGNFALYLPRSPLGERDAYHPHPTAIVETKALTGIKYPILEEEFKPSASVLAAVKKRTLSVDGNIDPIWAAVQQNDKYHTGILIADDVGMGKSRTAAGFVIDRIEKGKKRILVITKDYNLVDTLANEEFPGVYAGQASETGRYTDIPNNFPAQRVIISGDKFPEAKNHEQSLPTFGTTPAVYFIAKSQLADFVDQIIELRPDVLVVDEAHEFKNIHAMTAEKKPTGLAAAWRALHSALMQDENTNFLYLSATPAADLSDLEYLWGLKVWARDGFDDWVNVILGNDSPENILRRKQERLAWNNWMDTVRNVQKRGTTTIVELKRRGQGYVATSFGDGLYTYMDPKENRYILYTDGYGTGFTSDWNQARINAIATMIHEKYPDFGKRDDVRNLVNIVKDAKLEFDAKYPEPKLTTKGPHEEGGGPENNPNPRENNRSSKSDRSAFAATLPPAHTEQIMRELKLGGNFISRDITRSGVEFDIKQLELSPEDKAWLDTRAALRKEIYDAYQSWSHYNARQNKKARYGIMSDLQNDAKRSAFHTRMHRVVDQVKEALDAGEKVVVVTDFVGQVEEGRGGLRSAIDAINTHEVIGDDQTGYQDMGEMPEALLARLKLLGKLEELGRMDAPEIMLKDAFGGDRVIAITGEIPQKKRKAISNSFQQGDADIIMISGAGKTGINLHDITGDKRVRMIYSDYDWKPEAFKQALGRVDRTGQITAPAITFVHQGLSSEKKFIMTIASRLAGLGAVGKGEAASIGTGGLIDTFDFGSSFDRIALEGWWTSLAYDDRTKFIGNDFRDPNGTGPASQLDVTTNVFNRWLMSFYAMPVDDGNRIFDSYLAYRNMLLENGEGDLSTAPVGINNAIQERDQAKAKTRQGNVLRSTELSDQVNIHEVEMQDGKKYGIVEGVLTPVMMKINEAVNGDRTYSKPWRKWVQFYDPKDDRYISGLIFSQHDSEKVISSFGKMTRVRTPETILNDMRLGDHIPIRGVDGAPWNLYMGGGKYRMGKIVIDGPRNSHLETLMNNGAAYSPGGTFFYVPEDKLTEFLRRFPIDNDRQGLAQPMPGGADIMYGPDGSRYQVQYKVVPLADLVASHGITFDPDPRYPSALQPRNRGDQGYRNQVVDIARNLDERPLQISPEMTFGAPITRDNVVVNGNGRVMGMRLAQRDYPERWKGYQDYLRQHISEYGLSEDQLSGIKDPVLVRDVQGDVDLKKLGQTSQVSSSAQLSAVERAFVDQSAIDPKVIARLTVGENQNIEGALNSPANRDIVDAWLRAIPQSERPSLIGPDGNLSEEGLARLKYALFAYVYPGESGKRLAQLFIQNGNDLVRNVEQAMFDVLGPSAQMESMVRAGQRQADLTLSGDLEKSVDILIRLKQTGQSVTDYVQQSSLLGDELDPFQKQLLVYLDNNSRSRKRVRDLLALYYDNVINTQQDPAQAGLFGGAASSKGEILDAAAQMVTGQEQSTFTQAQGLPPTDPRKWLATTPPPIGATLDPNILQHAIYMAPYGRVKVTLVDGSTDFIVGHYLYGLSTDIPNDSRTATIAPDLIVKAEDAATGDLIWDKTRRFDNAPTQPEVAQPGDQADPAEAALPPPGRAPIGTTDQLSQPPADEAVYEGWMKHVSPALNRMEEALTKNVKQIPQGFDGKDMPPDVERQMKAYFGKVKNQMGDTKIGAMRWGEAKRDMALLNYSRRYDFDNFLGTVMPYEFWYTRAMRNWAMRALTKPAIFANYSRLRQFGKDAIEREGYPYRLRKKSAIRIPFMPKWMGDGLYIDPLNKLFPFEQLVQPWEKAAEQNNMEVRRAEGILQEMVTDESITSQEAAQALQTHQGFAWSKAYAQAQTEVDGDIQNPMDLAFMMISPSLPLQWAYNGLTGRPGKITQLPVTRTIQTMTAALGLGGPRGVNLEAAPRKALGLPEIDQYEDYRVDAMLSNLTAEGVISPQDAKLAMINRSGPAFTMAQQRVSQMGFWQYLGAPLGADFFPEGEAGQRQLRTEYDKAITEWKGGDSKALTKFFDAHPEYEARMASFQDPQTRLHKFLISEVWDRYNKLPSVYKTQLRDQLGDVFTQNFLDKETRSYDSINDETLASWAKAISNKPLPEKSPDTAAISLKFAPAATAQAVEDFRAAGEKRFPGLSQFLTSFYKETPEMQALARQQMPQIQEYYNWKNQYLATHPDIIPWVTGQQNELFGLPQDVQKTVYTYRAQKESLYPNIENTQTQYYNIQDKNQRSAYLRQHPELSGYWDWKRAYAASQPKAAPYIMSEQSLANAIQYNQSPPLSQDLLAQMSPNLVSQLLASFYARETLRPAAYSELSDIWEQAGRPYGSLQSWIANVIKPSLTGK